MQEVKTEKLNLRPLARYILEDIRKNWSEKDEDGFREWMKKREGKQ